jgi:hypothetical protein
MTTKKPKHKYLTPEQVAEKLGISEGTLANWRAKDMGPRWIKVSGKVMYKSEAVSTYILHNGASIYWSNRVPIKLNWRTPGSQA